MRKPDDLTGKRFGKLIVLSPAEPYTSRSGVKRYAWKCVCDCGNECVTRGDYLRRGQKRHCGKCVPPPKNTDLCRNCDHSKIVDGKWFCEKGLDTTKAIEECSGFWCGSADKITGAPHRKSTCFICGKTVYSRGNNVAIYCEEHRAYAERDAKILQESPMEFLFALITGIFIRARDDYLFDTEGYKRDAENFFRSNWAQDLTLNQFDAEAIIKILDEVIENGLGENRDNA